MKAETRANIIEAAQKSESFKAFRLWCGENLEIDLWQTMTGMLDELQSITLWEIAQKNMAEYIDHGVPEIERDEYDDDQLREEGFNSHILEDFLEVPLIAQTRLLTEMIASFLPDHEEEWVHILEVVKG